MQELRRLEKKLYALQYAQNVIEYDDATVAPPESYEGRGEAVAELSAFEHALMTGETLPRLLEEVKKEPLSEQEAAEVEELSRRYRRISCVPAEEYAEFSRLTTRAMSAWEKAKAASDFSLYQPYLEKIVAARRRFAALLDPDKAPYDVLLDQFEPGLTMETCDRFFGELREVITPLIRRITEEGKKPDTSFLRGPWSLAGQRKLSDRVMEVMGIDRAHCTIGESEHPFTTEFYKGDVRITTHYFEEDMASSFYSVVHEGGHALYELHIADRLMGTCLAGGVSMGLHESQSRLYENNIGRSLPFVRAVFPSIQEIFPEQLSGVTAEEFYKAVNVAEPSLIRTEADEVTYCLHIMVRYELEKQLIAGTLAVGDIPAEWNRLMKEYLGVEVPCDRVGCLQDVHWCSGDFGYFPSYALGTAYAAQIADAMRRDFDLDAAVERGELSAVSSWLAEKIWQYGKEKSPAWLIKNACGAPFDPHYYTDYLVKKYSEIYELD